MPIEGRKIVQLDGFKNTRKLDVGIMISCPRWWVQGLQVMRWAITHRPQVLPRSKHILAEGRTLEEDRPLPIDDLIGVTQNLRVGKERYMFVWLAESMDLSEIGSSTREILQCLWGWPSVRMRDSLNHIQGNDLGAGWIDHHTDLLLLFALLYGMVNLSDLPIVERRRSNLAWSLEWYKNVSLVHGSSCQP